jgi:hypothetical protein
MARPRKGAVAAAQRRMGYGYQLTPELHVLVELKLHRYQHRSQQL